MTNPFLVIPAQTGTYFAPDTSLEGREIGSRLRGNDGGNS